MQFKTLTQEEMDDMLVSTLKAQEVDLYIHTVNKQRYEEMLKTMEEGEFKSRVQHLLQETDTRITEVNTILNALEKQLPIQSRVDASILREKQKRSISNK